MLSNKLNLNAKIIQYVNLRCIIVLKNGIQRDANLNKFTIGWGIL